ncbi:FadD7 family fatty acid--CoA ligase [Streptomyces sp. VRA16 Mangrove soil]|uniref:FadD7 family fatty acid--CoA ligase n=1 Tax=Streptomyces sp. VRA16 Mangrove soil TaxID=2817434 RepID=UPI0027DAC79C|nr:FadD7 family fatty acid--CoA ligase [Streptomyces sp. VRA16 Mangrove soil]
MEGPITVEGLAGLLDRQARVRPHSRALVVPGSPSPQPPSQPLSQPSWPLSYRTLDSLADQTAGHLTKAGLRPGDLLGLVAGNTAEFVVALLGAARTGVAVAPLDPALPDHELRARVRALGVRAVLGEGAGEWTLRVRPDTVDFRPGPLSDERVARTVRPGDALVLFTAGTTRRARMVPLTHANAAASVRNICACYRLGPDDATVAVMPFFHGHGLFATLLSSLASGGCVLLPTGGRFAAETFWADLRAVDATWFTAVPTVHELLLDRSEADDPAAPPPPPLRFVRSCGAPLNAATQRALERMFGAPLLSAYGMTEAAHQVASEPLPSYGPLKHGTVGRATGVRLRVVDQHGQRCPAGVRGEVWVQGPTVARGYLARPADTARGFTDGWLRTGDLGSLDADGYLSLTGRIESLILRGGRKISPEYVEDVLAGCPSVAEAAVFAVPDAVDGQHLGAAVVVRGEECAGPEEILRYCRERLAAAAVPDRIVLVSALPRTAQGGLDRLAVRDRYA